MPANFLSEVARIKPSRRDAAYRGYLKRNKRQDTLQNRIDANVGLTDSDVEEIATLLTKRCKMRTVNTVRWALMGLPNGYNFGIFGRLIKHPEHGWSYCAGQSYPDEIRTVRELLIKNG